MSSSTSDMKSMVHCDKCDVTIVYWVMDGEMGESESVCKCY